MSLKVIALLAIIGHVFGHISSGDIIGKMVVGYQGWFSAHGDGSPRNSWTQWANNIPPRKNNVTFELYPDVREYPKLYHTKLANLGNGQPAQLFSSWDNSTVDLHFKWMVQYGLDVVSLQRYGAHIKSSSEFAAQANGILARVQHSSERHNRKFFITWDVSDCLNFHTELIEDINNLRSLNVFLSRSYARQNGRPVIGVWGFGFNNRPSNSIAALNMVNQLKRQGFYVIGGVPANWRTGDSDSMPNHLNVYLAFNMIQPWSVGRFHGVEGAHHYQATERADFEYCYHHGIDYQPVLYPGFAWSNWNGGRRNASPRLHGDFLWRQFVNIRDIGIRNAYLAMFDQYQEGTAIAKAAENSSMIPTDQYFLTLDADGVSLSSDFYLRVTREGYRMMKAEIPLRSNHNVPFHLISHTMHPVGNYPVNNLENGHQNQNSHQNISGNNNHIGITGINNVNHTGNNNNNNNNHNHGNNSQNSSNNHGNNGQNISNNQGSNGQNNSNYHGNNNANQNANNNNNIHGTNGQNSSNNLGSNGPNNSNNNANQNANNNNNSHGNNSTNNHGNNSSNNHGSNGQNNSNSHGNNNTNQNANNNNSHGNNSNNSNQGINNHGNNNNNNLGSDGQNNSNNHGGNGQNSCNNHGSNGQNSNNNLGNNGQNNSNNNANQNANNNSHGNNSNNSTNNHGNNNSNNHGNNNNSNNHGNCNCICDENNYENENRPLTGLQVLNTLSSMIQSLRTLYEQKEP